VYSFTIAILDNQNPIITNCPSNITVNTSTTSCNALVNWTAPAISDNCPGVQFTVSHTSGSLFSNGTTTVTYTATDASNNTTTCSFNVTVIDNVAPNIPVLPIITGVCSATVTVPTTLDNCTGTINGSTTSPLTYSAQGTYAIAWTFTDANANTTTASQTVIVLDNIAPTITAPNAVSTAANATCSATGVILGTPVTSDNCSSVNITNNAPASFPLGQTIVTWTATDAAGNSSTASQLVTVTDNTLPSISAPANITISANASCVAFNINLGNPIATDNCTIGSVTNNAPTVYPLGLTIVVWTITDASGNSSNASQTVTVVDNGLPIIVPPGNVVFSATTSCSIANTTFTLGNPYSTDNCNVASVTSNAPAIFPIGNTTVTWTVTDNAGNLATATQVVTVVDNTNPTITAPVSITVNTNTGCTATGIVLGSPFVSDNCAGSVTTNNAPTVFPLGNTIVTWTVTDLAGHISTAAQSVTVVDVTLPTITAPANISVSANSNCVAFNLNLGSPIVSDNCSIASVVNNGTAVYALGTTIVTWTITDGSGNIRTANQTVTVVDNSNPIITAPAPKTVNANAGCTATGVNLGSPVASDNCSAVVITNNAPPAFPIGNTTVTWTATDATSHTATATQIVTVLDNTNPTISAPAAITVNANSTCTATGVVLGSPIASDNCTSIIITNNAPTAFQLGQTIVTWTVTDLAGNTATATQSVTVVDNQNPTIIPPVTVNVNTNNSCMALNVNLGTPVTSDNCSVSTLENNAPSAFNVGTTVVIWTVTDGSGLTATATQNVIVSDNEDPIIIAPPNINANTTTTCSANGINLGTATAFDNCSVATITSNTPASFPVGTTLVVWTATDANGNTSTATQTVVINDVVNPTITAPSDITTVTNSGCTASGIVIGVPQTADNCGVASVSNDAPVSFPVGITSITWTVTDVNGNTAIAIQKVTVTDNMMPTLTVGANITVDANNSCVAFNVDLGAPVVADNCGIATLLNDAPTVYNIGTTTVTWIVTDNNGNSISATQTVTVVDNTIPVIIAPANMQVSTNNNCVASGLILGNPIATDNCTIASLVNNAPLDFPVGTTTVTYTVTDAAGNVATATQTITVSDVINPTALLQNIIVTLDGQGAAVISFADIDTGSSDNCGIASTILSQTDFNCSDLGVNNVTVIITDNNDNTTISTVSVTVKTNGIDSDNDGTDDSCDAIADPIEPEIPEAFTPNGNNINEYFVIGNLETFEQRQLNVYNRYGNSVYSSDNYKNDWDGTRSDNGQALPDATYYYVLKLSENDTRKGFVYINRVRQ
jgi:gliding motility-associated-like protein